MKAPWIVKASVVALIGAIIPALLQGAALGYDFPGKGSVADWSDALPYFNMGNKYMNQERFSEAHQKYQEAIQRYPYDPDFFINLGVSCRKLDDYVGAEQAYKSALALNDKDWSAWSDLGNAYLKQNRLKETISAFQHALKCNPAAQDKTNLLGDIADIHRVLRNMGEEPMPGAAGQPVGKHLKKPVGQRHIVANGSVTANKGAAAKAGSTEASGQGRRPPAPPAVPSTPGKDWGYQ